MLTVDSSPCPYGCRYCFQRFTQYPGVPTLADAEGCHELVRDAEIIYPACDVDLFARHDYLDVLERTSRFGASISVSTKASITERTANELARISDRLRSEGLLLKVGVSFSTKRRIPEIEPRTSSYRVRLRSLAWLAARGIASAVVLRPLLADIGDEEYIEIIDDCGPMVRNVLLGDEWLDIQNPEVVGSTAVWRRVSWLERAPEWPHYADRARTDRLLRYARGRGLRAFESDLNLMEALVRERQI